MSKARSEVQRLVQRQAKAKLPPESLWRSGFGAIDTRRMRAFKWARRGATKAILGSGLRYSWVVEKDGSVSWEASDGSSGVERDTE